MRTPEQQLHNAAALITIAREAAEQGRLPQTEAELQLTAQ